MKIGILQSSYLPWIGFFAMLNEVDAFVFHNDLQFDKSWRNRNRIRSDAAKGWNWLTVPVHLENGSSTLLNKVRISYEKPWNKKHWNQIYEHYHKSSHFKYFSEPYKEILLGKKWELLVDLNSALIRITMELIGIECKIIYSEDLNLGNLTKNERIIKLCKEIGADTWLANSVCRDYVNQELFNNSGIKVQYQDYNHPKYNQQYDPFISHLSIIDLIFNHGSETIDILRSVRET